MGLQSRALDFARLRWAGRAAGGFALVELLVALLVFAIALGMATQLYISNLRSTNNLRERIQMLDDSDFVKSWLTANLAAADAPPVSGSWDVMRVTASGRCYQLSLATDTHQIEARDAADCTSVSSATPTILSDFVQNTSSDPLFVFKDKSGNVVSADQASQVEVHMTLENPNNGLPAQKRTLSYALGGVYLANQIPNNSIGSAQLQDGSVTNSKIAPSAISGGNFSNSSISAAKLAAGALDSSVSLPLASADSGVWTAGTSWDSGPSSSFTRAGVLLSDYCVSGRTLMARGVFVVLNKESSALGLYLKLVRDDGQGGAVADFATMSSSSLSAPASGYGYATTDWQTVTPSLCSDTTTYFYSPEAEAVSGSSGKQFVLVQAALELRYS